MAGSPSGIGSRLIIGCRVNLVGVAARGHMNGRGPSLAMGGMKSELVPTKPNRIYPTTEIHKKGMTNVTPYECILCIDQST